MRIMTKCYATVAAILCVAQAPCFARGTVTYNVPPATPSSGLVLDQYRENTGCGTAHITISQVCTQQNAATVGGTLAGSVSKNLLQQIISTLGATLTITGSKTATGTTAITITDAYDLPKCASIEYTYYANDNLGSGSANYVTWLGHVRSGSGSGNGWAASGSGYWTGEGTPDNCDSCGG